jgi:hypothetical protein
MLRRKLNERLGKAARSKRRRRVSWAKEAQMAKEMKMQLEIQQQPRGECRQK